MDYQQPDFYKFSQDSIQLVNWVVKKSEMASSCLDIASGCGVIGIEVANQIKNITTLTLVEKQKEFEKFLEFNSQNLLRKDVNVNIDILSFQKFKPIQKYDIITGNLPYFLEKNSRPSPNINKDICRRWREESILDVIKIITQGLSDKGKAFLILDSTLTNYFQDFHFEILEHFKNVVMIVVSKEK